MHPARIGIAIAAMLLLVAICRLVKNRTAASARESRAAVADLVRSAGHRSQVDVRELLDEESASLSVRLHAADIVMDLMLCTSPLPVLVDRAGFREVLVQIVDLACRVMPTGGTLQMLARADGAHAVVNFMDVARDQGEPRLGRCFDEASASRRPSRPEHKALSMADVALCALIAGEHQGRIYAAPSPLGRLGITLRLPLCQSMPAR